MSKQGESGGMRLLKSSKHGFFRIVFSRVGLIVLLLLLQVALITAVMLWFYKILPHFLAVQALFVIVMVLTLINSRIDASSKITWLILIMSAPLFGTLLYVYVRTDLGHRVLRDRLRRIIGETKQMLPQDEETMQQLVKEHPEVAALDEYLNKSGCFPVYDNCELKYFPSGEEKFKELLPRLEEAKDFIFLEYFIIEEGYMWGSILEILSRKASEGVDVRVMYDGTNEFATLPAKYPRLLSELGIKCRPFAPLTPFVSTHYNFRDHRKILVIDGKVAFTGGINLSDRYINIGSPYGHWKDTAIMLRGRAVDSFTLLFLQMWNMGQDECEYQKYLSVPDSAPASPAPGWVIPYGDSPLDNFRVGEMVYIDILNRAQRYVHIMTPYLILDGELETALRFAAQRGVDVELILPGIPDKPVPYALAKTHYAALLDAGVKIYEYTPGFVHAKVFVSDDVKVVVGSINLDYRSLYHHFECAAYIYDAPCIADIEADFVSTRSECREVSYETLKEIPLHTKFVGGVTKAISTML